MKRKNYKKPTTRVVHLQNQNGILSGSLEGHGAGKNDYESCEW